MEAVILVDATNAFNRLDRQVTLLNCDKISIQWVGLGWDLRDVFSWWWNCSIRPFAIGWYAVVWTCLDSRSCMSLPEFRLKLTSLVSCRSWWDTKSGDPSTYKRLSNCICCDICNRNSFGPTCKTIDTSQEIGVAFWRREWDARIPWCESEWSELNRVWQNLTGTKGRGTPVDVSHTIVVSDVGSATALRNKEGRRSLEFEKFRVLLLNCCHLFEVDNWGMVLM